jgi:multiple antibiotic resistance protein
MFELATSIFITFFVIFDPVGTAPLFLAFTRGLSAEERRVAAFRATLIAGIVLLFFGLVGDVFLRSMGISIAAFRAAGGLLLLLLSIDMVFVRHSGLRDTTEEEVREAKKRGDVSVFPLAIPTIAGPGAITSVVMIMRDQAGHWDRQGMVLALLLIVLGLNLLGLLLANRIMKILGETGVNVVTRVLGIVLAAVAIQLIGDGIREFFQTG